MKRLLSTLACVLWLGAAPVAAATCQPAADALIEQGQEAVKKERYKEALAPFEEALRLCRAAQDPRGISTSLLAYGQLMHFLHRYADGEAALLEGLALRQQIDSGPNPDGDPERESMYFPAELMYLYREWSRYDLAWEWGDKALQAKAKLAGIDSSSYGTTLSNVSGIALATREYARGLPYARQAMDIWERTSGLPPSACRSPTATWACWRPARACAWWSTTAARPRSMPASCTCP